MTALSPPKWLPPTACEAPLTVATPSTKANERKVTKVAAKKAPAATAKKAKKVEATAKKSASVTFAVSSSASSAGPSSDAKPKLSRSATAPSGLKMEAARSLKLTHAQPTSAPMSNRQQHASNGSQSSRRRAAAKQIDWTMAESVATKLSVLALPTHAGQPPAVTERQLAAKKLGDWAVRLEKALHEGLHTGVADAVLEKGMVRVSELEEAAAEQRQAAEAAVLARRALAAAPSTSEPAAFREGVLVKLRGLKDHVGIVQGKDMSLAKYEGRMGRVVDYKWAPSWLMKAHGGSADSALVAVLLDSRSTDRDRAGTWLAVAPENLRVM